MKDLFTECVWCAKPLDGPEDMSGVRPISAKKPGVSWADSPGEHHIRLRSVHRAVRAFVPAAWGSENPKFGGMELFFGTCRGKCAELLSRALMADGYEVIISFDPEELQ